MKLSLKGETVLVTGGAKRLGRAIALECAAAGANVAITFHTSHAEAEETLELMREKSTSNQSPSDQSTSAESTSEPETLSPPQPQRFAALQCDLSDSQRVFRLKEQTLEMVGTPTALVNNAAVFHRTPFEEQSFSDWENAFDEQITANLKAPYLLCKLFGDLFLEQKRGAIVNLADIYGSRPLKNYVPYCLSKAGVLMLTETLAMALAPHVRVNAICPGTILPPSEPQGESSEDEMAALIARVPLQRIGTPEEIAKTALFLIGGPQFVSGAVIAVDGAQRLR